MDGRTDGRIGEWIAGGRDGNICNGSYSSRGGISHELILCNLDTVGQARTIVSEAFIAWPSLITSSYGQVKTGVCLLHLFYLCYLFAMMRRPYLLNTKCRVLYCVPFARLATPALYGLPLQSCVMCQCMPVRARGVILSDA